MKRLVALRVNGVDRSAEVEPRKLLVDFLREDLGLTGTHVGCEHGACGACTILLNGQTARACLLFAAQAAGHEVTTVEGLAAAHGLSPLQESFWEHQGLQCGFCTPGMLLTASELLAETPHPSVGEIREAIAGVLCRCTGYQQIVRSIEAAAARGASGGEDAS